MAENDDGRPVLPPDPEPPGGPAPAEPILKTRWRDRAWSFRAMLAVALATLVLGGVAGGTVVALADDDHRDHHGRPWMGPADRVHPHWRNPGRFDDGGPQWRWDDGPQPPPGNTTPYSQPSPPTPSPSQ